MNKRILPTIIIVLIAGASFYAGMKYSGSGQVNVMANRGSVASGQFRQLTETETRITGEILSKDDKSIVLKIPAGGSKIIFYSASTKISEITETAPDKLKETDTISIFGTTNQDGSITAESIQIRPIDNSQNVAAP